MMKYEGKRERAAEAEPLGTQQALQCRNEVNGVFS